MSNLDYALSKAREIPYKRGYQRHYALVLDKKDRIISEAANSYTRTHTAMARASKKLGMSKLYAHAECLALIRAKGKGCKLVVVRVDAQGNACYSAPCPVCSLLIQEAKHIKSIEYSV